VRLLVGDIGGTNARLALAESAGEEFRFRLARTYASSRFDSLPELVRHFLGDVSETADRAALAVACPVISGRCRPPNLGWTIDVDTLGQDIGIPDTRLLNDFDAVGRAIPHLSAADVATIRSGTPEPGAPMAALGAGTGLGVVFLHRVSGRYRVIGSEGGHVDFAPRNETQMALWEFLRERHAAVSHGHVSCERVLSGAGILAIHDFLVRSGRVPEHPETRRLLAGQEPARVLSRLARERADPAAVAVFDLFFEVLGALAGDLALLAQARGGVYVAGGIAMENRVLLERSRFVEAFEAKGRLADYLARIPVHLIVREDVGLLGAAWAARDGDA